MFDIITFGSATWDVYIKPKKIQEIESEKFTTGKGVCFSSGSKVDIEEMRFFSGGGGTNTAATFARQGFKTAFCGMVGQDLSGEEIIKELKRFRIDSNFVAKTGSTPTSHSIIINYPDTDRTILVYRGASELLDKKNIPWGKLNAKWFYLAPLSGKLCQSTEGIINFAHKNKIKIAFNPGNSQISFPQEKIKDIIKKVDILFLNQEEASILVKIPYSKEKEIFKKIDEFCPGIAIMTKGELGVAVSDGKTLFSAEPPKIKVVDRTGAGDSFASGFVSGFIKSDRDIEYAIQIGIANSNACLKTWGAKEGLLKKDEKFSPAKRDSAWQEKIKIDKIKIK